MAAASGALERVNRSKKRLVGEARSPSRNDEYLLYQTLLGTWPLEPLDPGRLAGFGLLNSLSQVLLKLTVPGVPDIYQGNELWAFNLVDPDNRRPVDYRHRQALLETLDASCRDRDSLPALLREPPGAAAATTASETECRREQFKRSCNGVWGAVPMVMSGGRG